jgi:hypothetical protein
MTEVEIIPEVKTRAELAREAFDYRRQGNSYFEIAEQMRITEDEVVALVNGYLASASVVDPPVHARLLDIDRANLMLSSIFATAAAGDIEAIKVALRLMRHRSALDGSQRHHSEGERPTYSVLKRGRTCSRSSEGTPPTIANHDLPSTAAELT